MRISYIIIQLYAYEKHDYQTTESLKKIYMYSINFPKVTDQQIWK